MARRGWVVNPRTPLLGAQDHEHPQQDAKGLRTKAKGAPQEIWLAGTKEDTVTALETFVKTYQVKYRRAADCLIKDRDALLAF